MEKHYNAKQSQLDLQNQWAANNLYTFQRNDKQLFSIDTPPPTVSGSLHIGHIFSYTHTDITARFKRMDNFSVFYPFGFDDNGLATERFVEKKRSIRAHEMSRSDFIACCLQETTIAQEQFKSLWQALGLSVDWNLSYSTISPMAQKISQESFIELYNKGFIYRNYEPAPYCATCRTSVAQAELDDAQQDTTFNDITFKLNDGTPLTIATTRPEFLPACVAVLYHPGDTRYNIYANQTINVPLFDLAVPLLAQDTVSMDKGTGLVMCCVFGDKQDIAWIKNLGLEYASHQILSLNGKMNAKAKILEGLNVTDARKKVIELLKEQNLITAQKPITNTINIHERCKKPIEYQALSQWFIKLLDYKQQLLDFSESVVWHPSFMKTRFTHWVENLGWDWCISRQRFYGIPFPVWHCVENNHIIMAPIASLPVDPQETSLFSNCPTCGSTNLVPDTDVMDTWNTSSLTPQLCYKLFNPQGSAYNKNEVSNFLPMSIRPQAHDIIRTWAFDTLVKAWMHYEDIVPWQEIVISGHVLSDAHQKISKSQGNSKMEPLALLELYSADAIRYWTASGRLGHDVAFSESQLKIGNKLITKLWNAFKFIKEHADFTSAELPENIGLVNQWLLEHYNSTLQSYKNAMNEYEVGLALQHAEEFFWKIFCDNYLELIKDQLFNPGNYNAHHVAATKIMLSRVGLGILQLFAPYLVYVTDSLYRDLFYSSDKPTSIHITQWDSPISLHPQSLADMEIILSVVDQVRRYKTEHQLSLRAPLKTIEVSATPDQNSIIRENETLLKGMLTCNAIIYGESQDNTIRLTIVTE